MTVVKLITDMAPFPRCEEDATPDRLGAHFAALAYMAGRVALTHPDASVAGHAHRDLGLYYALAHLMRELAEWAPWAAENAAKQLREELEDGTHIALDLADWLCGYDVSTEVLDAAVRVAVAPALVPAQQPPVAAEVA